jgi:prepilin-type N-terminal cleavage/methylation domain-containing protein
MTRCRPRLRRCHEAGRDAGFSLLEVLVALAILATALVVLARIVTGNVMAANHSRMTTAATFLARSRISMMEQSLLEYGFAEMDGEDEGTFSEEGFPRFRWYSAVERIELPADATQQIQDVSNKATTSTNPMEMLSGFMGGFMSTLMDPIRLGLEESVRKLTVRVMWDEPGKPEQSFEVVSFLTDPSRLETAVTLSAAGAAGAAGAAELPKGSAATNPVKSATASSGGTKK